jgi:hypothetical protein
MPLWHIDADRFWRASACLPDPASPKGGRCPFHLGHERSFVLASRMSAYQESAAIHSTGDGGWQLDLVCSTAAVVDKTAVSQ